MPLGNNEVSSFGSIPEIKFILFELFNHRSEIETKDFKERFISKFSARNIDGILFFLDQLKLISYSNKKIKKINSSIWPIKESWEEKIILLTIEILKEEKELKNYFYPNLLKIEGRHLVLDPVRILQEYIPLRNMFIELGHLKRRQDTKFVSLSDLLRKEVLKYLPIPKPFAKKKISQQELEEQIQRRNLRQKENGDIAEKWVLKFEKKKFKGKVNKLLHKCIERVSQEEATLGYDILSIESIESSFPDKFIEVKSFENNPTFYWSSNEMRIAREKKDQYYLYLIDRTKMQDSDYSPIQIKDPIQKILDGELLEEKLTLKNFDNTYRIVAKEFKFILTKP